MHRRLNEGDEDGDAIEMGESEDMQSLATGFLNLLREGQPAVALTGAGVSTASGIPDFRGPSGLYSKVSPQTFHLDYFLSFPEDYYRVAIKHIHTLADREPNVTHRMLAALEDRGLLEAVITQNIDGLHQKAGSRVVIEYHGDVHRYYCMACRAKYNRGEVDDMIRRDGSPRCRGCGTLIRPGIVFFDDPIPQAAAARSQLAAERAEVFVCMGSSLEVYPAALLPQMARQCGARLAIVNRGPTKLDRAADLRIEADLSEFSQAVVDLLNT